MRNRSNPKRGERGQVLIFVTVLLMLAALILPPVLSMTSAANRTTQVTKEEMQQYYAADMGLDDVSYRLRDDPGFFARLGGGTFPIGEVNGCNVTVKVEKGGGGLFQLVSTATDYEGKTTVVNSEVSLCLLTISSSSGGSVTEPEVTEPEGSQFTYAPGTVVMLVAVADQEWGFVNWTLGPAANPDSATTTITMNGDYSIKANFAPMDSGHTLEVGSGDGGNATEPGEGNFTYPQDRVVDLVAVAEPCHVFVNWTGGPVANPNSATTTILMDADYDVQANFAIITYGLITGSTSGGSVTTPGEPGPYTRDCGQKVDIVATAEAGYSFINWTGDVGTVGNVADPSTTITMLGNYAIQANFAQVLYALNVSATAGGNVTQPGVGSFIYGSGSVVPLAAVPQSCYRFVNWTGDVGTVANPNAVSTTITMNGNCTIVANFAIVTYLLTTGSTSGGSVTNPGQPGPYTRNCNQVVDLVATPNLGYSFVNWTGNVATIANPSAASTTITMKGNYAVQANFQAAPYQLTVGHTGNGAVNPPGEGTFSYATGTVVHLVAVPAANSHFVNWTGSGTGFRDALDNAGAADTTITMNNDYSVVAHFASGAPYIGFDYALASFGALNVNNNGVVNGDVYAGTTLSFGNNGRVNGDAYSKGAMSITNNNVVDGNAYTLADLAASNNSDINGNAYAVTGITSLNNGEIWGSAYSEAGISLKNNCTVHGDAWYKSTITMKNNSDVLGGEYKEPPYSFDLPPFPVVNKPTPAQIALMRQECLDAANDGGTYTGTYTVQNNQTVELGPLHITGNLVITNNCTIILRGAVFVDGTITIQNNCSIVGPGTIAAQGNIEVQNGSMLAPDDLPVIFSVNGDIVLKNNGEVRAVLFAPNGTVDMKNNCRIYGAVAANAINTWNNFTATYAEELRDRQDLPGS